ncbi:hypothetical protein OEB99_12450 [Actinotalea sp. M2MS4P-6]|uniref:hypothetical protein n=1 Tax=Actinotalea sp. M2MS4P-6 TaxID=2983762 RepID=UPI0021E396F4|nr:hypothetical protein [Actinotalea sp. M2MS4P-6]MCV2395119.1 hypothetical protein [Actinotalea sp. M2MS4P-6]
MRLAGSLWSVPRDRQEAEAQRLAGAGLRRWHWDVSDGVFAAPGGFSPADAVRIGALTGLPGEAHLMVERPLDHLSAWIDICDTVTVHVESADWEAAVEAIRRAGRTAAVAISPGTPLDVTADLAAEVGVLVMSVVPGQAGSGFVPGTYARLVGLGGRDLLGVDGSVDLERGLECARHGATWLVSGTAMSAAADPHAWIAALEATGADGAERLPGTGTNR